MPKEPQHVLILAKDAKNALLTLERLTGGHVKITMAKTTNQYNFPNLRIYSFHYERVG